MDKPSHIDPFHLVLGTAFWGWTVETGQAFALLDAFYRAGFRKIDTATNYPINRRAEDFRQAEKMLAEWTRAHGISDLEVIVKIGSLDNSGSPRNNLSPGFLMMNRDYYLGILGSNLYCLMLHWDNRNDEGAVAESLETIKAFESDGIRPGLSGVKFPAIHASLCRSLDVRPLIELKHNLWYSGLEHYEAFSSLNPEFIAYGITGGGMKLNRQHYRQDSAWLVRGRTPEERTQEVVAFGKWLEEINSRHKTTIENIHHAGLLYAFYHEEIDGVIIGPSRLSQLEDSLEKFQNMKDADLAPLFAELKNFNRTHGPL